MTIVNGWLDWAYRNPGVADKVYSEPNRGLALVGHSIVGTPAAALGRAVPGEVAVVSWTVIQRKRMTQDERDLGEFFDPMTEAEAYSLALRLTTYDAVRCSYRVKELPEC